MNRTIFILLLTAFGCSLSISENEWANLRIKLERIRQDDQLHRTVMDSLGKANGWRSKEIDELWRKQEILDSINQLEIRKIVEKFGFPPKEKVGEEVETVLLVLQHSPDSVKAEYCDLVVGAGKKGDLSMMTVAFYQDHVLMTREQPQEYGSQVWVDYKVDPKTGQQYDSLFLWTIRDPQNVNKRRIKAGLDSIETYLRHLDIDPAKGYALRKSKNPAAKI